MTRTSLSKTSWIALAGNPNSGKTTIFNCLTGLRQKVGNYPGVTIEKKVGILKTADGAINVLDLPGTYSLSARSRDEEIARDAILGRVQDTPSPDLIVCVLDAANLGRNLYLASQILDLGRPTLIVLNMIDVAERAGIEIDTVRLQEVLGVPVVGTTGNIGKGIDRLVDAIENGPFRSAERRWTASEPMEHALSQLARLLAARWNLDAAAAAAEAGVLLGEADANVRGDEIVSEMLAPLRHDLTALGMDWRSEIVESRYRWIQSVCDYAVMRRTETLASATDRIDAVLTHKVWGWLAFLSVMATMFFMIFSVASYPMGWIDSGFTGASEWVKASMPSGDLRDLITDGMIAGVGSVVIFLPQILILFFFIGLLEDTGYMARGAFIIDRLMSKVGLHGKSFIPLLSSFACAIPGIMAARTIESRKDRLVTMLVAPLMSCSARLPVYTVMIATLLPNDAVPAWQKVGIMLSMYVLGTSAAFGMAFVFKKTLLKGETPSLIMELPPYRLPSIKSIVLNMWQRSALFLKNAGTVILALSIVLWGLMTYPKHDGMSPDLALQGSFAGMMGRTIEPVIKPLGYDWRIGIGLIGSFAAREVFVSTMGIVFNVEDVDEEVAPLTSAFRDATWPDGRPLFTPLVCLSLMVFFVLAMQCISTIAVIRRETNGWKWPLFQLGYMTVLAWVGAFVVFQGGRLFGWV